MARMGMDVDAVEDAGRKLQSLSGDINGLMGQVDSLVNGLASVWDGKDVNTFVHDWWPHHKTTLKNASDSIHGLGQSALNNASEQRTVSDH